MAGEITVGGIKYDLDLDDSKFKGKADQASKEVHGLAGSLDAATAGSEVFAGGVALAGAALVGFGVSSVSAFNDSQAVIAQLDAVLKSTHQSAGLFKEDILEQATALQSMTKYSDEAVTSSANLLLTFTNIKGPVMQQAIQTTLDMSTALGVDLKGSAIQLGKALNDPIQGVSALRRVGVSFNETQLDTIKKLQESGKLEEAQTMILEELSKEFGGSAVAAGQTFAGQIEIAKNKFNDFQELVGQAIAQALTPMIQAFNDWFDAMGGPQGLLDRFNTEILPTLSANLPIIVGIIIGGLVPALVAAATAMWALFAPLIPFIAIGAALGFLVEKLIEHFGGWNNLMIALQPTIEQIGILFNVLIIPAFEYVWNQLSTRLLPALQELWTVLSPVLIPVLQFLAVVIGGVLITAFLAFISFLVLTIDWLTRLVEYVSFAVKSIVGFFQWLFDTLIGHSIIPDLIMGISDWFHSLPGRIADGLSTLFNAIVNPFRSAFDEVKKMANDTWNEIQKINPFHRNSPSLVDNVVRGVEIIKDQYASLSQIALPAVADMSNVAPAYAGAGAGGTVQNINIYVDKVSDMSDIQSIGRELGFRAGMMPR